ncbi:methyl-accepting chemotaxis protein [Coraliomargarita akajimensis]|uniref:Methyl-accepting chemotaxis sensory transducer n=1 Tax=Coraliomargarita akajimensis (strain DSM 45221 / IAM 15411 / JCM 23193 / KCTC 12865 / 04OKA010-24) TaxID=583355 RepID=D5ELN2_CORAD|nr:methyl-accepting chemotaxis protein [Coraliomargarita akajimensis]ADE53207.1 methyl-accepting chemotaxis sensory transducer [Coraliomargarita akajimensis DSM 45221]
MKTNQSQSRTLVTELLIAILLLAAAILVPIITGLSKSRSEQARSEELSELNQLSDELSEAISHQAIERGSGNTIIASAGEASSTIVDINLLNRKRGDERVAQSLELATSLEQRLNDPDFKVAVENWKRAYTELVAARPRIQAKQIQSAEWLGLANRNIDAEKALIAVAFAPRDPAERTTFYNSIVRASATDIIHYLGQQRAVYGATLSSKAPITAANEARLVTLSAQVNAAVAKLAEIQDRTATSDTLGDEIRAFRARYNGSFKDFVNSIRKQSDLGASLLASTQTTTDAITTEPVAAKPVYTETPAEWFKEAGATIQLASNISLIAGEEGKAASALVTSKARNQFILNLLGALLVIAVLCAVFYWFRQSVIQKVSNLTKTSQAVASGNMDIRANVSANNELGLLANNFNQMVSNLVDAERAAEEGRATAEDERAKLQEGIQHLLMATSDGSDGDLTVRAPVTEGTLGNVADAFNLMAEEIGDAINDIKSTASDVATRATNINQSTTRMRDGANKQTEEISNARQAVEQMAEDIEAVATNATEAAIAAEKAKEQAEAGQKAVDEVIEGMERIRTDVQASTKKIKQLGESTMEISSIIGTIQDISEQTNMLALNAAIEAARAGEHGRGFTVVAEEVRKLAERAASATSDIEDLISGIQAETNQSVESMELQIGNVENETMVVGRAGHALSEIAQSSVYSSQLINQISDSAKQQVLGANSVVDTMQLISGISQETMTTADSNKESTEYLDQQANLLLETTGRFKT